MDLETLEKDVCQLKRDMIRICTDIKWIKGIGLFIAAAIVTQLAIKLFTITAAS